jgi:hypothetical protein
MFIYHVKQLKLKKQIGNINYIFKRIAWVKHHLLKEFALTNWDGSVSAFMTPIESGQRIVPW